MSPEKVIETLLSFFFDIFITETSTFPIEFMADTTK